MWLFIDKKTFARNNGLFKLTNIDWSFDWNITKWKILCYFTFQICYWDTICDVL
jgi:hypothetical protein